MSYLPEVKIDPKVEYQRHKDRNRKKVVQSDIAKIETALSSTDESELILLHKTLDGKYQTCISDWGKSMYGYFEKLGFNYEFLDNDSIKHNLTMMKSKLESFMQGWNEIANSQQPYIRPSDVNVTVNNTVNVSISFQKMRRKIEDMTALNQAQTDEILEKIDELEKIEKENISRKIKWEKVKPIITFALDKGADVAIAILSLVVQMKIGV